MGKSQRVKGHSYEREIARRLRKLFPKAERLLEYQASQAQGVDLKNTGRLAVQCKRYKSYAPVTKIFEVNAAGKIPVLITKADNQPDMVVLSLEDFLAILEDVGTAYG